jgi:hypothetical protein
MRAYVQFADTHNGAAAPETTIPGMGALERVMKEVNFLG